jgi:hypothetical protein
MTKTRELIERIMKSDVMTDDELMEIAEEGVNYIVYSALTDPENEAQIETLVEPKYGTPFPI